ncbi:DUF3800 domain-containing protein [Peterkaempfera bronchialis]|uniref:DUF3800 domain-containing protein n=1 Tax=Peterkaempfera bronchialis TaxID=2126346 RepID=A0A345T3J6_9ACTN|nr:DUF3800 domain-containing protein [Peterkaempfera bronchialis]AXI80551.1 hypothetical protein C7M71_027335 [Peterkaempfera bronchialis]
MWMVFVDDSKTDQVPRAGLGQLVALGAVFVPERALGPYGADLAELRSQLGVPDGVELKWNPGRAAPAFWRTAGPRLRTALRRGMLERAADHGIRSSVVVWDRGHLDWPMRDRVEPAILAYLYERIERFLAEQDALGVVIADEPGHAGGSWLRAAKELTRSGTPHVVPERVALPILTAPSHLVPHLQLADLVAAATTAAVAGRPAGLDLLDPLARLARRNDAGRIGGAGLVLWPPQLMDLHFWLFGEQVYWRRGREHPLGPASTPTRTGRTFQHTDGLTGPT